MEKRILISRVLALVFLLLLAAFQLYQNVMTYRMHYRMFAAYASNTLVEAMDAELNHRLATGAEYLLTSKDLTPAMTDSLLQQRFGTTGDTIIFLSGDPSSGLSETLRNAINHAMPPDPGMLDSIYHSMMQQEYPGAETRLEITGMGNSGRQDASGKGHHITPAIDLDSYSGKAIQAVIVDPQRVLFRRIASSIALSVLFVIIAFVCTGYQLQLVNIQKKTNTGILDYLWHITHQLKSPITVLGSVMDYAGRKLPDVDPLWTQQVALSKRSIRKLASMVDSILRYSVSGKTRMLPEISCFNLPEAIRAAMEELQLKWAGVRPDISVVDEMETPDVSADKLHLCDAVANLVDNAVKYSPAGVQVVVRLSEERKRIRIAVKDNGPGIPPEEIKRIFETFYRGSGHPAGVKGHGLGLGYVQTVCMAHDGQIKVYSSVGEGSEFVVWLPVHEERKTC